MLHADFMALCFMKPELLPIEVYIGEIGVFDLFGSCDLDLDPVTFMYELDPYSVEIYPTCEYELRTSRLSKVTV